MPYPELQSGCGGWIRGFKKGNFSWNRVGESSRVKYFQEKWLNLSSLSPVVVWGGEMQNFAQNSWLNLPKETFLFLRGEAELVRWILVTSWIDCLLLTKKVEKNSVRKCRRPLVVVAQCIVVKANQKLSQLDFSPLVVIFLPWSQKLMMGNGESWSLCTLPPCASTLLSRVRITRSATEDVGARRQ